MSGRTYHLFLILTLALLTPMPGAAEPRPSAELLLPYFEIELDNPLGLTTLFTVANWSDQAVSIEVAVYTNWGIQLDELPSQTIDLLPRAVVPINLGTWLRGGNLPNKQLSTGELQDVQAALSGQPVNQTYYGSEVAPNRAVGYVEVRALGRPRPAVLWGDYFNVDPTQNFAQGDVLVHPDGGELCERRAFRFLEGGPFSGSQIVDWSGLHRRPDRQSPVNTTQVSAFNQQGQALDMGAPVDFLPVQETSALDLGLGNAADRRFGWLDLDSSRETFVTARYSAENAYSVGMASYCLSDPTAPASAARRPQPSSHLLLPLFEVDLLDNLGRNTLFDVVNSGGATLGVELKVYTNWGIELTELSRTLRLGSGAVSTIDVRNLLQAVLDDAEKGPHVRAALTGQKSPDGYYYSSALELDGVAFPDTAVGFIEIESAGQPVLWGDYFVVDWMEGFAKGDVLVNLDQLSPLPDLCLRHGLRFLEGPPFDGTEIVVWTRMRGQRSTSPSFPGAQKVATGFKVYDQSGRQLAQLNNSFRPVELLTMSDLLGQFQLNQRFGWLDLQSERDDQETFMAVRYSASNKFSVGLMSHCLPPKSAETVGIDVEKSTNGQDADKAPGPSIMEGDAVEWTYEVKNTGDVPLANVTVSDDDRNVTPSCDKSDLDPGESMTCRAAGTAAVGQYRNVATATGTSPQGQETNDSDRSHYLGEPEDPKISIEKKTNGVDADQVPGPQIPEGDPVEWTYEVKNTGNVPLANVTVTDDDPSVSPSCPKNVLDPLETMTCRARGTATVKSYENTGTATGTSPRGRSVNDFDLSHYGIPDPVVECDATLSVTLASNPSPPQRWEGADFTFEVGNSPQSRDMLVNVKVEMTLVDSLAGNRTIDITDLCGGVSWQRDHSLIPGDSVSCPYSESRVDFDRIEFRATAQHGNQCTVNSRDFSDTFPPPERIPTLTLIKKVINDNTGTARVADFPLFVGNQQVTSGVATRLQPGNYTVRELNTSGYTAGPWVGACSTGGTVTLALDDKKTCEITNDDVAPGPAEPGILTLIKHVVNDNGGTLSVADVPLFVDSRQVTSGVATEFPPGTYTVSETNQPGYSAGSWSGDCAADGTVTLTSNETKTCEITNDDEPASLTLIKHVVNDDGGTLVVTDFPLFIGTQQVASGTATELHPGTYSVSETNQTGYTAGPWRGDCTPDGTVTLALGEHKTCEITNATSRQASR